MTKRNANSEIGIFVLGSSLHGKKGSTLECLLHSRRINASDLRTSATLMSWIAEVVSSIRLGRGLVCKSTSKKCHSI